MTRDEAIREIETAINVPKGSLTEATPLADVKGWDSTARLAVMAMFDDNLGVVVPPKKLAKAASVAEILELVAGDLA